MKTALVLSTQNIFAEITIAADMAVELIKAMDFPVESNGTLTLKVPSFMVKAAIAKAGAPEALVPLFADSDVNASIFFANYDQAQRPKMQALKNVKEINLANLSVFIKTKEPMADELSGELDKVFAEMDKSSGISFKQAEVSSSTTAKEEGNAQEATTETGEEKKADTSTKAETSPKKAKATDINYTEMATVNVSVNNESKPASPFLAAGLSTAHVTQVAGVDKA